MPGRIIITYTGEKPSISVESEPAPPTPPVTPPVVIPPPSTRVFTWPDDWFAAVDPAARAAWWWLRPGMTEFHLEGKVYAFLSGTGNPVGHTYHNAGIIQVGKFAGTRLWAPLATPDAMLISIIETGDWHP